VRLLVVVAVELVLERVLVVDVRLVVLVVVVVVVVVVVTTVAELEVLLVGPGELLDKSGRVLGVLERGTDDTGEALEICVLELE
jgi:hypothetical protein